MNTKIAILALALIAGAIPAQAKTTVSTVQGILAGVSGCSIISAATVNLVFASVVAGTPIPPETATGSISYQCSNVPTGISLSDGLSNYALQTAGAPPVPFTISGTNAEGDNLGVFHDDPNDTRNLGSHAKATDTITLLGTLAPTVGETVIIATYLDTITVTLTFV